MEAPDSTIETSPERRGFDYCFWSKLLVAIVLFPLVAYIAAWFFAAPLAKIAAAAGAIGLLVFFARKIDRMACFSGMIPALIGRKHQR